MPVVRFCQINKIVVDDADISKTLMSRKNNVHDVILRGNVHAVVETSHIRTLVPPLVKSVMLVVRKIILNPCEGQ
jgi:hypothetical protein